MILLSLIFISVLTHSGELVDVSPPVAPAAPAGPPANPADTPAIETNLVATETEPSPVRQPDSIISSPPSSPPLSLRDLALAAKQRLQANEIKRKVESEYVSMYFSRHKAF